MRHSKIARALIAVLALACGLSFAGCKTLQPPPPIRYLAVTMPKSIPKVADQAGQQKVTKTRVGFLYRPPLDAAALLKRLHKKSGAAVLKDVKLRLVTPYCYILICVGTDAATGSAAGGGGG